MPGRPLRPCSHPGCSTLVTRGFCESHQSSRYDIRRGSAAERLYGFKWRKARRNHLEAEPFCRACRGDGRLKPATVVDHITPHRGNLDLFWDRGNWQSLCKDCHDAKTLAERRQRSAR